MKRILSTIVLSAALLTAGTSAASAAPVHRDGVKICQSALILAHVKGTERSEDRAAIICGRTITTDAQANALYRWARNGHRWALDIIG